MLEKDSLILGLLLGLCIPFVGFATIQMILERVVDSDALNPEMRPINFRPRTIAILAVCLNLIPFNIYKNWRFDNTMKGVIIATFIYVFVWVLYFANILGGLEG